MTAGPARIARGCLTDAARPLGFRFDGQPLTGLAGDTLASALLANGRRLVGRSFKYHRPRGILTAGADEPCALVDLIGPAGREPNRLATTLPLTEGLVAESQNRWPSLRFDVLAFNDLLSRFLPAGFYYKTFMAPGWAWERLYEPLIRRAAGLGRLAPVVGEHAAPAETVHDHTDVLVVGSGAAGLAAACTLGASGLRVLLADQDVTLGAGPLLAATGRRGARHGSLPWRACRQRAHPARHVRARRLRARRVRRPARPSRPPRRSAAADCASGCASCARGACVLATGATERLIAFPGNDVPGVMLAGAALAYLHRYGVAAGRRPALFANNDEAYESAVRARRRGHRLRRRHRPARRLACGRARPRARHPGTRRGPGHGGRRTAGRARGDASPRPAAGPVPRSRADCLLISGGHTPASAARQPAGRRA